MKLFFEDKDLATDWTRLDCDVDATASARHAGEVQRLALQQVTVVPLHRQMITWASRRNVMPVVMPDNAVRAHWVRID